MNVEKIWLDGLQIGDRLREIDQSKVESLATSMSAIGLRQPISVWADEEGGVHLVAGLHRVKAAELLKWETIDAILVDMSDIDRRRWEIAENLHRSELKVLERDQHVAEWIKLTEEADKLSQVDSVSNKGGRGKESGTRKAAREIGVSQTDASRAVRVASLTDEAKKAAREVGLDDNRSALLQAAAAAPESQPQVLREIAKHKAESDARIRKPGSNQHVAADELDKIRALSDFDLVMLISEIHDQGWPIARKTLRMMERAA